MAGAQNTAAEFAFKYTAFMPCTQCGEIIKIAVRNMVFVQIDGRLVLISNTITHFLPKFILNLKINFIMESI